ncbi:hypothetical protein BH09ACT7_BH09ACT7_04500 [soil metagenome]
MTLNQLRAFLEAHQLGSFTAAADALGVAQASISELVRRLEDELDAQLFVRGSRRLALTAAGQELLPYAEQVVHATDSGTHAVRSLGSLGGGTATFGMPRNADYYLLSSRVQTFHMRYPAVRVRLVGQNSAETAAAIQAGEIEAGPSPLRSSPRRSWCCTTPTTAGRTRPVASWRSVPSSPVCGWSR